MTRLQVERVVECLETALAADRGAVSALLAHRVPCNDALAGHPTVQVGLDADEMEYVVGCLGLLNGVLSSLGLPLVAARYDARDGVARELLGFRVYDPPGYNEESEGGESC